MHRFTPGDPGEMRSWAAELRASVQRLALPQEQVPAPEGVLRRPEGESLGAVVVHDADEVAQSLTDAGFTTFSLSTSAGDPLALDGGALLGGSAVLAGRRNSPLSLLAGRSPLALMVDETLAAVDKLAAEGIERIGLYGAGDGAAVALHAALLARDPLPLAVSGHMGSYSELAAGGVLALPGILRHADLPDLYCALAPRPLLVSSTDATAQPIRDAYKAYEAPERLVEGNGGTAVVSFFTKAFREPVEVPFIPPLKVIFDIGARLEVADRIDQILASGILTQGKLVGQFEELARKYTGGEPIAVSTGTAALDIAYQLLEAGGKTVLVPVNTFFATAASVERVGGKVEFVDVELDGLGMDPQALREALDRHDDVAAVVVVHIGGVIAPSFREVLAECTSRGIPVVEDAAHALGSRLDGGLAGTFGQMATYSLHPAKVVTSGEGGFFTAKDPQMLQAARKLRDHGKISTSQNIHDRLGNNWRLSEVHAAVGLAHFARLDGLLSTRRELAAWYDDNLDSVPRVKRYVPPAGAESNYYKYMAFLDPEVDRAELKARLRQRHGVALAGEVYDVLLSDQPYFAPRFQGRTFERARWFAKHHICLPAFPTMTRAQQRHVLHALQTELS
jgi:dTDP-4-amino-4,6-dideoxygalactose transaminase